MPYLCIVCGNKATDSERILCKSCLSIYKLRKTLGEISILPRIRDKREFASDFKKFMED